MKFGLISCSVNRSIKQTRLHGVHCNVHFVAEQSVVNLLGEQALAPNVCQRLVQDLVTSGLDDADLNGTLSLELGKVGLRGGSVKFMEEVPGGG